MTTEEFIIDLKSRVNKATKRGYEYDEIGALLGISKQAATQHVHDKRGRCLKCLRRLKPAPKFPQITKKEKTNEQ